MNNKQRGIGFLGILFILIAVVIVVVLGMKLTPAYIEYFTVKKAVVAVAQSGGGNPAEIRKAFNRQADIDDITVVSPADLQIAKDSKGIVVSFAYEKRVHLFANISLLIDFEGSSDPGKSRPLF